MAFSVSSLAGRVSAGPWSLEPQLGLSAGYWSNPELQSVNPVAEQHAAALFNLPLRYDVDGMELALDPSGRISNSSGYSSLASNSLRVDADAQFSSDLGSFTLRGAAIRDSTLYSNGLAAYGYGVGVREDMVNAAAQWTRSLTERAQLKLDTNWSRVLYDQPPNVTNLVDYRYLTAGPTVAYALSERNTLKLLGGFSHYQSLGEVTASTSENLQVGFDRRLSEIWTLSTNAGYSISKNSAKVFFGPFYLGTQQSHQDASLYAVKVSRQGERFNVDGGITQSLQPTGFAYLAKQNSVTLHADYTRSERWAFSVNAAWQKVLDPLPGGTDIHLRYLNLQLTAQWHWTPQWLFSFHVSRDSREYHPPSASAASNGVSVDIVRQFLRIEL